MSECMIAVNDHTYKADRAYADNCIKIGKKAMKGKNAIIGVEKENRILLLNETHPDKNELNKAVAEYESNGFKVYKA